MERIAVVDDDLTTSSLIKMLLEMEGYYVSTLPTDPDEIIVTLINDHFNILFIDVHLHNQNGLDIVQNIRALHNLDGLLILMTSGMELRDKCIAVGANGFLQKPFMPAELLNWIKLNLNLTPNT